MLIKLFNKSLEQQDTYKCAMQLNKDNSGFLFFNQILSYKQIQLLGCHFSLGNEERVQQHIKYRHAFARI